ncbi:TetR/AcrR family transcriptional regulator [Microtetraspora sp. AC03309]|uniref:TetR/AcrR family transcriptional regulator n=1 Tax=Microtetraspora sp. AC03309 TaxID=2779376 RepID=UPI001E5A0C30|nr:TetR/AcrR family transcriptional regulator [Microtetraspora sp. AC03309]MCC5579008.1 TetR/AcrR family transcriptional regulator [Microtetraspora sp. AC03309]
MPRISAPNLREHRAQTVNRIIDAVARLSRNRGIDAISMTDVAAEAGVARTVLYNYFPDKAALLLAFSQRVTDYFVDSLEQDLREDVTASARLESFIRLQLKGLLAHPHPGAAEITAALGPDAYQALAGHVAPMHKILCEILAGGIQSGEFRDLDVEATARSILAVIGAERIPLVSGEVTLEGAGTAVIAFVQGAIRPLSA